MEDQPRTVIGEVSDSYYYSDMKKIRAVVNLPDGHVIRVEIPNSRFTFRPGMDEDVEMAKLSSLMIGKKITVKYEPESK